MANTKPSHNCSLICDYCRDVPEEICQRLAELLALDDEKVALLQRELCEIRAQYYADKTIDVLPRKSQIKAAISKVGKQAEKLKKTIEGLDPTSRFLIDTPSTVPCQAMLQSIDFDCYPGDTIRSLKRLILSCEYLLRHVPHDQGGRPPTPFSLKTAIYKLSALYVQLTNRKPTISQEDSTGNFMGDFFQFASFFLHSIDPSLSHGSTIGYAITQVLQRS